MQEITIMKKSNLIEHNAQSELLILETKNFIMRHYIYNNSELPAKIICSLVFILNRCHWYITFTLLINISNKRSAKD